MGESTAKMLARHYGTIEEWQKAMQALEDKESPAYQELVALDGVGPRTIEELAGFSVNRSISAL